jgi:glycosyltransferase involved in cell wall biosynthesis
MISVILCTYNRAATLRSALASLQAMDVPGPVEWELVVVDNNSADDTPRVVAEYQQAAPHTVRYVFERTQGHAHARNRGIHEARGATLAFIDDDVLVDRHWLGRIHEAYEQFDCIGVGGKIIPVWPCEKPRWMRDHGPNKLMRAIVSFDLGDTPCVLDRPPFGANMSFKRAAFERYGLFRTDLGRTGRDLSGGEDTEFGRRLLHGHETVIYEPAAVIYHPVEPERLTKAYWRRWYFAYGRMSVRRGDSLDGAPAAARARRLARRLSGSFVRWMLAFDLDRRFHHKLRFHQALGQLREACHVGGRRRGKIPRLS